MHPVLELNHISFQYSRGSRKILNDVTCSFEKGKVYAVTGRSGAGKLPFCHCCPGSPPPPQARS